MSDTAWMADLVLPAPSYLERQDPVSAFLASSACSGVITRDPVVPALFESRPVFWIVKELANRLDLGEHFDFTIEDFRKAQLEKLPEVARALKAEGVYNVVGPSYGLHEGKPFQDPSGKIELYNARYAENGIDPMPVYRPPGPGAGRPFPDRGGAQCLHHPERQHQQHSALGTGAGKQLVDPPDPGAAARDPPWRQGGGRKPGGQRASEGPGDRGDPAGHGLHGHGVWCDFKGAVQNLRQRRLYRRLLEDHNDDISGTWPCTRPSSP